MFSVEEINYNEWVTHLKCIRHTNLLQCWQYGTAKEQSEKWKAIRFIVTEGDNVIALVQLLTRTVPLLGGVARINRGPLLNKNIAKDCRIDVSSQVIEALLYYAHKKHWWIVQIAPELPDLDIGTNLLGKIGLQKLNIAPHASGLLSLSSSNESDLLKNLKGKWRNCLRKGMKLGVIISVVSCNSDELNTLISKYRALQKDKNFFGISDSLIISLAQQQGKGWEFTLFIANEERIADVENSIGMLVSIRHGDTSTYLIGYTNDEGRKQQANYVLLWEAILYAKQSGCDWFDIGGLSSITPKGVAHFKQGINAELYSSVGEWRWITVPMFGVIC